MTQALLVSYNRASFSHMDSVFADNNIETIWAESGGDALIMIQARSFDLIIVDEVLPGMTGLYLAKKLISKNPMLNIAVVSALPSKDFHEISEGLGILMQLPKIPKKSDAKKLLEHLKHILTLMQS
jgi:DNA-binding response OmpR family regulator